jgi:phytoene synthase
VTSGIEALAPLPCPRTTDPQQVVDAITARARSSFAAGMRLLPRPRRAAMRAIYAFARVLDDIADGDWPATDKLRLLDDWRTEVGRLRNGEPVSAIGKALSGPVARYDLPEAEFLLLIEGMEMDARGAIIAPSNTELRAYTRRVAGTVGILSMRVFGAWKGQVSEKAALTLGDAFQLTNILRDVAEDARRGRVYLPREALESVGIETLEPGEIAVAPDLWRARAECGRLARTDFLAARRALAAHERRAIAPALMMTGVYEGYLAAMEADGFRETGPVALGRAKKLWLGLRSLAGPVTSRGDG